MELLLHLKSIILEKSKKEEDNILIDKFDYENQEILLFATKHQWYDRYGYHSFDEIKDIYEESNDSKLRIGVPNEMIFNFFKDNFKEIEKKFKSIESNYEFRGPRLVIIKNRKKENDENPEYFDFAEFIIQKKSETDFYIITSAFSKDGFFLKSVGRIKYNTPRLTFENKFYFNSILII